MNQTPRHSPNPARGDAPAAETPVTIKRDHLRVLGHYSANGGDLPAAVRSAGYASKTAVHSIKRTKSWNAALDKMLPELHIAKRHRELLDKRELAKLTTTDPDGTTSETLEDIGPDTPAVSKALDMAYKLRGRYVPEAAPPPPPVNYNLFYSPVVQAAVRGFEDDLKRQIINETTRPAPQALAAPEPDTPAA